MPHQKKICDATITITPLMKAFKAFHDGYRDASSQLERDGVLRRFKIFSALLRNAAKNNSKLQALLNNSSFHDNPYEEAVSKKLFLEFPKIIADVEKALLTIPSYT